MTKRTKIIWACLLFGLIAAVCVPLLRKPLSPPNVLDRFCIVESSLACDRVDWVHVAPTLWDMYLPNGTYRSYKFVRRETGFFSNGTVVASGEELWYIPDEGEEASLRFMRGGEWFNYSNAIRVPGQIEIMYQNGAALLAKKQSADAISQFDGCIKQDPRFTAAYLMRANANYQLRQMDKVRADCDKAIELTSNCPHAQALREKAKK